MSAKEEKAADAAEAGETGDLEESTDLITVEELIAQAKESLATGSVDAAFFESFVSEAEAEIGALKAALAVAEAKAAEAEPVLAKANDQLLRLNADFENYRKRTSGEKEALASKVKGEVITSLLPVIDNFELAKTQLKLETEGEQKVDASYQSLYRQLVDAFRGMGLDVVPGEGSAFDPNLHEAIMREPNDEVPDGTVLQEFRRGFLLGEQLLRPAMVKVSFTENAPAAPAEGNGSGEGATEDVAA